MLSDVQVAERVPESLSPYAVLGNEIHPLPYVNIQGTYVHKSYLELFFCKKYPLSRHFKYVMDGSMDESVSQSVCE